MEASNANRALLPILHIDLDPALADNGLAVLRNLIARRQIGIEIILAIKYRMEIDLGTKRQSSADRLAHAFAVYHWQHSRHRSVD